MGDANRKGTFEERKSRALAVQTFPIQRLFDLVRYARAMLHEDDLITDEEYAMLAGDHPAVARLEEYDDLRVEVERLKRELDVCGYVERTDKLLSQRDEARAQASDYAMQDEARVARITELEDEVTRLRDEKKWVCPDCLCVYTYQMTDKFHGLPLCPECKRVCTTKYAYDINDLEVKVARLKRESAEAFADWIDKTGADLETSGVAGRVVYGSASGALEAFRKAIDVVKEGNNEG